MLSRFAKAALVAGARYSSGSTVARHVTPAGVARDSQEAEAVFAREDKYGAHNYHPLPVALCKGKGTTLSVTTPIYVAQLDTYSVFNVS